ncbi:Transposase, IS30 family, partial [gut metagenome]
KEIGCSPSTVTNELRRGTPPRKSNKGRKPGYSAKRGEAVYKANRKHSRRSHRISHCPGFLCWVVQQFKEHKWSLDACVGYARLHSLFSADEMVCTRTLYNEVWAGNLDLSVTELPEALKRKRHKESKPREYKKHYGKDIT